MGVLKEKHKIVTLLLAQPVIVVIPGLHLSIIKGICETSLQTGLTAYYAQVLEVE